MASGSAITKMQPRGKPWAKGVSGNPSGRRKRTEEEVRLVEACRQKTREALATIEDIMLNGSNERSRLAAAQYILDRGWGRAPELIKLAVDTGPVEVPVLGQDISPEDAYALVIEGQAVKVIDGQPLVHWEA